MELLNVIVADDDEDIRLLCRINLETAGFTVHEASDAEEALELTRRIRPLYAIVLDVSMPGRGGLDCLAELKADPLVRHVPVIVLSGHVGDDPRDAALGLGAADYMTKPFRTDDLVRTIEQLGQA